MPTTVSYTYASHLKCWHVPTIVLHCFKIQTHQIGKKKRIPTRVPRSIANMQSIRGVCTAPGSRHLRIGRHIALLSIVISLAQTRDLDNWNVEIRRRSMRSPPPKNAPCGDKKRGRSIWYAHSSSQPMAITDAEDKKWCTPGT